MIRTTVRVGRRKHQFHVGLALGPMIWGLAGVCHGAPILTTLVHFNRAVNGAILDDGVRVDAAGNLYGTTAFGGASDVGTVFRLEKGTNVLTTLASFSTPVGVLPASTVIADAAGNLYGTAASGGVQNGGTVFRVDAVTNALTAPTKFDDSTGRVPIAGLIADAAGNFYGTTSTGGPSGGGTVFRLAAGASAPTTLASFGGANGSGPRARLTADAAGNLFGTTWLGGQFNRGTVFRVDATTNALTTLVSFNSNGMVPLAGVILDAGGNLYGTTAGGFGLSMGTVFRVDAGTNALTTLAVFNGANGSTPTAGVILDSVGNLFGTTSTGGQFNQGTVFRIDAVTKQLKTLVSFDSLNGEEPSADLIADPVTRRLYGTTRSGGTFDWGTVFELSQVGYGVPEPAGATLLLGALATLPMVRQRWK